MNKEEIKSALLKAAGNPESGVIVEYAEKMAEAILLLSEPEETNNFNPVKETRITPPAEARDINY
jgi:hypothetical protein